MHTNINETLRHSAHNDPRNVGIDLEKCRDEELGKLEPHFPRPRTGNRMLAQLRLSELGAR